MLATLKRLQMTMDGVAGPIRKEVLKDKIAAAIRGWILDGTLRPGERLVELQLAARLEVSRAPLREALLTLEREGLVRVFPHRGARVVSLTEPDIREIFEIRETLECLAARRIQAEPSERSRRALEGALAVLESAAAARDVERFSQADLAFHRTLWEQAGSRHLREALEGISARFFGYELIRDLGRGDAFKFDAMAREHRELLRLIFAGDPAALEAGFRAAFRCFLEDVLRRFARA